MGTVVGSASNGEYDLARGLAMYDLAGDLWQLDARIIQWKGLAALIGLAPGYRLQSLGGRFLAIEQESQAREPGRGPDQGGPRQGEGVASPAAVIAKLLEEAEEDPRDEPSDHEEGAGPNGGEKAERPGVMPQPFDDGGPEGRCETSQGRPHQDAVEHDHGDHDPVEQDQAHPVFEAVLGIASHGNILRGSGAEAGAVPPRFPGPAPLCPES